MISLYYKINVKHWKESGKKSQKVVFLSHRLNTNVLVTNMSLLWLWYFMIMISQCLTFISAVMTETSRPFLRVFVTCLHCVIAHRLNCHLLTSVRRFSLCGEYINKKLNISRISPETPVADVHQIRLADPVMWRFFVNRAYWLSGFTATGTVIVSAYVRFFEGASYFSLIYAWRPAPCSCT